MSVCRCCMICVEYVSLFGTVLEIDNMFYLALTLLTFFFTFKFNQRGERYDYLVQFSKHFISIETRILKR